MSIEPTPEQMAQLAGAAAEDSGPIVMLNLLRFKAQADGIDEGVSGVEAYGRYGEAAQRFLSGVGGKVLFAGAARHSVIGPVEGEWDLVILVRYPSRSAFLAMITDAEYLAIHAHRDAALADSRLVALEQVSV
jgi:uncharacterized protein (DUF1330 family)